MSQNNSKLQLNTANGSMGYACLMVGHILLSFLGQLIVGAIFGTKSNVYVAICSTFSAISIFALLAVYVFYGKNKFTVVTSVTRFKWYYVLVAVLLSAGMFLGFGFVNESIGSLLNQKPDISKIPYYMPTVWHFIVCVITFAILPAIFEELFFRGLLLNSLSGMKSVISVLITALCFAFYHKSFAQFLYQFIYGVGLGFLAKASKSVVPGIIAHFINNFSILLFYFIKLNVNLYNPILIVIGINALAVFCSIIFLVLRKREREQAKKGEVKKFFLPFGIFGMVVCIAVAVSNLFV